MPYLVVDVLYHSLQGLLCQRQIRCRDARTERTIKFRMLQYKDNTLERLETLLAPPAQPTPPAPTADGGATPPVKKVIRPYNRSIIFPAKKLETMEDVDDYVEKIREQLKQLLKNCDGIQLK